WSVDPSAETLQLITALCASMGHQLITLNVWIEDLDEGKVVKRNILELYEMINTQLPILRNLTLYLKPGCRNLGTIYTSIDLRILRQLEKCVLRVQDPY